MIKLGLMGCGMVADYGHVPAIKQTAGLSLRALFDPDPARLAAFQEKFDVPHGFTDPEAFFRSGIDAVTITSPAPCHLDNVLHAARHAKHVLCEKPLAMNDAEAVRMIDAMKSAALKLYVGFDYRFSPAAQTIKRLIAEGAIGVVRDLRLIYIWDLHGKYDNRDAVAGKLSQRRELRMKEGGPMVDCGVHQIDLARWWLASEVVHQESHGVWVDVHHAPDHVYLHMDHAGGAHTMVEMSYSYSFTAKEPRNTFTYEIIGTDGIIVYDRGAQSFEMRTAHGTTQLPWSHEKNFHGMYEEFAKALQTGHDGALPTAEDGLIATRIARRATDEAIARRLKK